MRTTVEELRAVLQPAALADAPADAGPVAAVLVLLRPQEGGLEVLLGQRASRSGDPWSGHISLPGGRHRPDDGDLLATAVRETREEANVDVDASSEVLGHLAFRSPANLPGMSVVPFIAWATRPVRPAPGPEMTETFWVPLEDLPACEGEALVSTAIGELHVPAFLWNGRVIWGFTYRVLGELLGLVGISR